MIVTYQSSGTLERCLDSLMPELASEDTVTVVDNASIDGSASVAESWSSRNLSVIRNEENLGYSKAANQGMASQGADAYLLLNPDAQLCPGWRSRLMTHLEDERVGAVGPLSDNVSGRQFVAFHLPSIERKFSYEEIQAVTDTYNLGTWETTKFLSGQCLLLPDRVVQRHGGLDEDLVLGGDDLEISWRLRRHGLELRVARDVLCRHIGQHSFDQLDSERKKRMLAASTEILIQKVRGSYVGNPPTSAELWGVDLVEL